MLKRIKKCWTKSSSTGQNMTEYILVFVGVVFALVIALGPTGFLTRKIEDTMNLAMVGTKCIALQTCFDPAGCPTVCGNDCCEAGESITNCPVDCSLCMSAADCDDGIACNGAEWCDPATGCQPGGLVCSDCGPVLFGQCATYWESATVPFGDECQSEERCCEEGGLSGSYMAASCSVSAAANCGPVPHGGSATYYQSATVACGSSCVSEVRTCDDGILSGSYTATSCSALCTDCIGPDGANIVNGGSRIYYQAAQVDCWTVCNQQVRSCVDGVLSGSFTEPDPPGCFVTVCNDGVACTDDTCVPNLAANWGCVFIPSVCDDGVSCTDDYCDLVLGCQAPANDANCPDDGVACTNDYCDTVLNCQYPPDDSACDDGDACSGIEMCDAVLGCQAGIPLACDDGDACNGTETCDAVLGCQAGIPLVCDDGDVCTGVETCDAVLGCQAGIPLACDDGDACNGTEMCDAVLGCQAGIPLACDDGDVCNGTETCDVVLGCQAGVPLNCGYGDICTGVVTCDAVLGCQTGIPLVCDDGDVCNGIETCAAPMGCRAGALVCDDGDPCTTNSCVSAAGCQYTPPVVCILPLICVDGVCM